MALHQAILAQLARHSQHGVRHGQAPAATGPEVMQHRRQAGAPYAAAYLLVEKNVMTESRRWMDA